MASTKFYGTGRRKSSVARVYLVPGTGKITINKRDIDEYFGLETLKVVVRQPLTLTETLDKFDVLVNVHGGGFTGQAGAIRHGISRALLEADSEYRPALKAAGFLTRDPRMKERNTVSKQLVVLRSSARDNLRNSDLRSNPCFTRVCGVVRCGEKRWNLLSSQRICNTFATKISKKYRTLFGDRHWRVSFLLCRFCIGSYAVLIF